jgi:hypothetical protein
MVAFSQNLILISKIISQIKEHGMNQKNLIVTETATKLANPQYGLCIKYGFFITFIMINQSKCHFSGSHMFLKSCLDRMQAGDI